mmetsp:Transcript_72053/g.64738  ORF Transcript_72053/g.64738 Transcript_72053/m.64738 type:complete len:135 (+) Transcript_72053:3-407(+)
MISCKANDPNFAQGSKLDHCETNAFDTTLICCGNHEASLRSADGLKQAQLKWGSCDALCDIDLSGKCMIQDDKKLSRKDCCVPTGIRATNILPVDTCSDKMLKGSDDFQVSYTPDAVCCHSLKRDENWCAQNLN